ncbi:MAG: FmdB family zinc ribbon protein [Isosphaerales bacterium]
MPTYDYICDSCGHEFEAFEPITSQPRTDCPECKLPKLRRKIGPGAAILFKGSGFYQTDYRSDSYKKAAQADKTASEPAKPATESKPSTDSKSAGDSKSSTDSKSASDSSSSAKSEPAKTARTSSRKSQS